MTLSYNTLKERVDVKVKHGLLEPYKMELTLFTGSVKINARWRDVRWPLAEWREPVLQKGG